MCRLVAYLGQKPLSLAQVICKTNNGLIYQSRRFSAKKNKIANADGFGFGWYNANLAAPEIYKSTKPLYQHLNFLNKSKQVLSSCFIGHIRAATIGPVLECNCHPFVAHNSLFAHNGTIGGFAQIRSNLQLLGGEHVANGDTDSELFFNLMQANQLDLQNIDLLQALDSFRTVCRQIKDLQKKQASSLFSRLNIVLTDGQTLFATRYVSNVTKRCLSLYYQVNHDGIIVASEPLTKKASDWFKLPVNHAILANLKTGPQIMKI